MDTVPSPVVDVLNEEVLPRIRAASQALALAESADDIDLDDVLKMVVQAHLWLGVHKRGTRVVRG
jgi:hypothetical protein